jgi:23S rRNA-/tRNA-specific pseudouridylate synthase
VLIFGTRVDAWERIRSGFREHRIAKTYRAVVVGRMEGEGSVDLGFVTARHRPAKVRVVTDSELSRTRGARMGSLHWRCLENFGDRATLLEVAPRTGHLHQIRATFAHLGFPIGGDAVYGKLPDVTAAPRQMLHASRLHFEAIEASSPDPPDFLGVCERLRDGF